MLIASSETQRTQRKPKSTGKIAYATMATATEPALRKAKSTAKSGCAKIRHSGEWRFQGRRVVDVGVPLRALMRGGFGEGMIG